MDIAFGDILRGGSPLEDLNSGVRSARILSSARLGKPEFYL
jgi:hypothetical protein